MANTLNSKQSPVLAQHRKMFMVPSATTTTIIGISLANISGTGINVSIGVDNQLEIM